MGVQLKVFCFLFYLLTQLDPQNTLLLGYDVGPDDANIYFSKKKCPVAISYSFCF